MMDAESLIPEAGSFDNFINDFSVFAAAPGGIENLKKAFVNLALKGGFSSSNNEETSNQYLTSLQAGEYSKNNGEISYLQSDEYPFEIPDNWSWVTLASLSDDIHYGYTASADHQSDGIRLLRITDIQNDKVNWDNVPGCEIDDKKLVKNELKNGDLLIARTGGTIGKSYLVENLSRKAVFASYLIRFKPKQNTWSNFVKLFTWSDLYWEQLLDKTSGSAQPNVNATSLKGLAIPIPPLEEQKRIVAKVAELMALVDKLEAQQQEQANTALQANIASINDLLDPLERSSFDKSWNRIATHFNVLYGCTLPMPKGDGRKKKHLVGLENLSLLRSTIIDLALIGKITNSNNSFKTIEQLLNSIAEHRNSLIESGVIKKEKQIQKSVKEEDLHQLPQGWKWCRLDEVGYLTRGSSPRPIVDYITDGSDGVNWVKIGDTKGVDKYIETTNQKITVEGSAKSQKVVAGDFILSNSMSFGKPFIMATDGFIHDGWFLIKLLGEMDINFFYYLLSSNLTQRQFSNSATGAVVKNIKGDIVKKTILPIPPIDQQINIVAKVDELLKICDKLEDQLTQAYTDAETLMQATVKSLVA